MIPQITAVIQESNFEKILNRIGEILTVELNKQYVISYWSELESLKVYKDRSIAFGHSEVPAINVCYHSVEYSEQDPTSSSGFNLFHIDCIVDAEGTDDPDGKYYNTGGDILAKANLNKLMGIVRTILEDPKYSTLGFARPSIGYRQVMRMYFMKTINADARNIRIGRIEFQVKAPETPVEFITPVPIGGNNTHIQLEIGQKGYFWEINAV